MRYEIVELVPRQAGWQEEEEEAAAAEASGSGNWRGETSNSVREGRCCMCSVAMAEITTRQTKQVHVFANSEKNKIK